MRTNGQHVGNRGHHAYHMGFPNAGHKPAVGTKNWLWHAYHLQRFGKVWAFGCRPDGRPDRIPLTH